MLAMNQFGNNIVQNSMVVVVLPVEIERQFPSSPARTLAILVATAAAFTLLTPLIGMYSDRTTNRMGRRRPILIVGTILTALGLFVMVNIIIHLHLNIKRNIRVI